MAVGLVRDTGNERVCYVLDQRIPPSPFAFHPPKTDRSTIMKKGRSRLSVAALEQESCGVNPAEAKRVSLAVTPAIRLQQMVDAAK